VAASLIPKFQKHAALANILKDNIMSENKDQKEKQETKEVKSEKEITPKRPTFSVDLREIRNDGSKSKG
jgi:type II secretory pathway component PulC